jgi:pyruvate dehydrogenase phosphatase regulatory subunit
MKSESVIREVECELVDLDRIKDLCPLIRTEDLQGGLWIPGDGVANPFEICLALSVLAHKAGARIVSNCCVEEVVVDKATSAVAGIKTSLGYIECESFINAAGVWARYIGTKSTPRVQVRLILAGNANFDPIITSRYQRVDT